MKRAFRSALRYSELTAADRFGWRRGDLAVIYGNCQAEPLRQLLTAVEGFPFRTVRIPPVHLIDAGQVDALKRLMTRVGLLVHQPVSDGYRHLGLGSDALVELLGPAARAISFPVLYFRGLHPFQVYVRDKTGMNVPSPITGYHDLRAIYAAARGWSDDDASAWFGQYALDPERVVHIAQASKAELARREQSLDVRVAKVVDETRAREFMTVNHPSDALLEETAAQVLASLGIPGRPRHTRSTPFLDEIVAPVGRDIADALGAPSTQGWIVRGHTYESADVFNAQLAWLRASGGALRTALDQHEQLLSELGLAVSG